jgi:nitrogen PTS system EIIA component
MKREDMAISKYLDKRLVLFLDVTSRDAALKALIDLLDKEEKLLDKEQFFQAILERERVVSTGIGMGVAIPHAKLEGYQDFFIAIGIQSKRGIEWNALDGLGVRLIFMIGGPDNRQTKYLKILSCLTMAIKDEERRKKLLKATRAEEVIALFEGC